MLRFLHTSDWQLGMTRHFLAEGAQERYSQARFDAIWTMGRVAKDEGCQYESTGKTIGKGWKADYYLHCIEATDPVTGWRVPLAPSWIIGQKTRTIARLIPD